MFAGTDEDLAKTLRSIRIGLATLASRMTGPPGDRPSQEAIEGMRARYRELEAELARRVRTTGGSL